jgi:predicted nucleotidyltransferase
MADALFTSTQRRVLALLFGQPHRSFYASELIALTKAGSGGVQRELARLTESGLLASRAVGGQRHYQANPASPIYNELQAIVLKTVALVEPMRFALRPVAKQVRVAFVYGSVAKNTDVAASDIDLFILSDSLSYGDLFGALESLRAKLGRQVNPTILTQDAFARRLRSKESFITRVLAQEKIWLIGSERELES